ncbi:MAG: endolytic transglycosylase MltG [Fibrobacteraceae bacterium]|nr:endolytic transglycosylase MltG [Fibrobacteraceae bacterium]
MKKIVFAILTLLALISLSGILTYRTVQGPSQNREWTTLQIPNGASAKKIGLILKKNGLISHQRLFTWWVKLTQTELKAGWYDIPPKTSIAGLVELFTSGKNAVRKVTIPEGRASWEMPAYFRKAFPEFDSTKWEILVHDSAFAKELGVKAPNLEGYLLPETYAVPYGSSEKNIASLMVKANLALESECEERDSPIWKELGSWHRVLTLASIVEEETGKTDERALIAGVFLNRLRQGIPLGADPTVRFIYRNLTGPIYKSQLDSDSPYNTRKFKGLMPGPISNPGKKAIEAALFPQNTDALYFVAKDDGSGTHFFSKSLKDHDKFRLKAAENRGER